MRKTITMLLATLMITAVSDSNQCFETLVLYLAFHRMAEQMPFREDHPAADVQPSEDGNDDSPGAQPPDAKPLPPKSDAPDDDDDDDEGDLTQQSC